MLLDDELVQQGCAYGVDVKEFGEIGEVILVSSQVDDGIDALQRLFQGGAVADITNDELGCRGCAPRSPPPAGDRLYASR